LLSLPPWLPRWSHSFATWFSDKKSYARYAARVASQQGGKPVTGVKVYCVVHQTLSPKQILDQMSPEDPTLYSPYFEGEFDADGKLKDPEDPLLYWLIPITGPEKPSEHPTTTSVGFYANVGKSKEKGANYLLRHAEQP
jgi:hypothetical protein